MKRIYEKMLEDHFGGNRQMALLSGPRQVGKTTLARQALVGGAYMNYDVAGDALKIAGGCEKVAEALKMDTPAEAAKGVIFDEIHKYPKWKGFLKGFFDTWENRLKIIATGSARMDTYRRGGDSLVGRVFGYRVHPLSLGEIAGAECDLDSVLQAPKDLSGADAGRLLEYGGFPEPFLNGTRRFYGRWQNSRMDKIFNEDLRDLSRVQDLRGVRAMAELLRGRVGGEMNFAAAARDLGVAPDTAKNWFGLLESVYFCYQVRPYHKNVANSIRKTPKAYLWDWSLLPAGGARSENFVASHLLKSVDWWTDSGLGRFELCYIRDKQQREVDFAVARDGEVMMLVEVKTSMGEPLSGNLKAFAEKLGARYAFQVAVDAPWSGVDLRECEGRVVKAAFADLAGLLI